jgi:hypothetical protein
MACEHAGPPEVIEMAEERLRGRQIPEAQWAGRRFRHSENLDEGMWASVVIEVERRNDDWVVTRLDRSKDRVEPTGLEELTNTNV